MSELPFAALAARGGFCPDPRFAASAPVAVVEAEPDDPVATARSEGFAAGFAEASAVAEQHLGEVLAAREAIGLALVRCNAALEEQLRQRLQATVEALCGEVFAIAARDAQGLSNRIARAATLLARADDGRVLRLHPDDIAVLGSALPAELPVEPDLTLARGALRIEGGLGGVEDGPEIWRRALAEALAQC